jgi:hypothetical protein
LLEGLRRDKTRPVLRTASAWARSPLTTIFWAGCAIGASAGLSSCGGRAADALEAEPSAFEPDEDPTELVEIHRETCEDNPLLAGCPRPADFCRENPRSGACSSAPEPDLPAEDPTEGELLVAAARNVLLSYCGGCHGSVLTPAQAPGSFNFIDDWSRLVRAGYIERCSPERSRLIVLMREGDMPPRTSLLPPVLDSDIDVVEQAIDVDCQ